MRKKVWAVSGPEFGHKEGMKVLVSKASHSLNASGSTFWELLADMLRKLGFTPTIQDSNVRIKPRKDVNNCVRTNVDNSMLVAKHSASHINKIKATFNLRSEGKINYFLGHDTRGKNN